jgi:hypothetical protein
MLVLQADSIGLDDEGWALRYHLEGQLTRLSKMKVLYLPQRSRLTWLLKGDAKISFLHAIADRRRRKYAISRLTANQGVLEVHINDFYRALMGASCERGMFSLIPSTSGAVGRVSDEENDCLMLSFTNPEMDAVRLQHEGGYGAGTGWQAGCVLHQILAHHEAVRHGH